VFGFFIFKKKTLPVDCFHAKKKQNKSAIRISARKKRVVQVNRRSLEQTRQQKKTEMEESLNLGLKRGPAQAEIDVERKRASGPRMH
jgi:hypothetical protein